MNWQQTQSQNADQQEQARALSLTRTRPPRDVPGYDLHEFLGAGAYGEVWVGADQNTGRRVAVKFYAQRASVGWSLIYREVEKLVFLSTDRYVVQLLDVAWDSDPPYYVMEFVEGGSLADLLNRNVELPINDIVSLFREIAIGLLHAHGKGVLHCDLKPENVLLDQDRHPRLADFGQSRLTHEQVPALGTLFYMAPEQANLQAVPDARWDVYALGAILYCLLTGKPPHSTAEVIEDLERAPDLDERLARYRRRLLASAPPARHIERRGIDWALVQIVDRCLATNPEARFANVQEVIDALDARARSLSRRPLVTLGFVGPVLLLLVMALFGWRGYHRAMIETETLAQERAVENNRLTARFAAENVAGELSNYFDTVRQEAARDDLHDLLLPLLENSWLRRLNDPQMLDDEIDTLQRSFRDDEQRFSLDQYLELRLRNYLEAAPAARPLPRFASMFLTDARGTMLAAAYDEDVVTDSIGRNWAHRAYFKGGVDELSPQSRPPADARPIERTHLSPVFKSVSTGKLKVAISTPVFHEVDNKETCIGVLVMTINHGDLELFRTRTANDLDRFPVLVDGRAGPSRGTILVHPLFSEIVAAGGRIPEPLRDLRVSPAVLDEELNLDTTRPYVDPLHNHPLGQAYDKRWIAAAAPVELWTSEREETEKTGLVVLVQEDFESVITPVRTLGRHLVREALSALMVVVAVVVALWYFVSRFVV